MEAIALLRPLPQSPAQQEHFQLEEWCPIALLVTLQLRLVQSIKMPLVNLHAMRALLAATARIRIRPPSRVQLDSFPLLEALVANLVPQCSTYLPTPSAPARLRALCALLEATALTL